MVCFFLKENLCCKRQQKVVPAAAPRVSYYWVCLIRQEYENITFSDIVITAFISYISGDA